MAKKYFLNGKAITAAQAREVKKNNEKLIARGTLEDLIKCKLIGEADEEGITFGFTDAPNITANKKASKKSDITAGKRTAAKSSAKKPAAKPASKAAKAKAKRKK